MAKIAARTGSAPFSHLLALVTGRGTAAKRAEEDEKKPDEEAEEDEEKKDPDAEEPAKEPDAEEEDEKRPDGKKAKAKRAKAEDDEDESAECDDDDEEEASARHAGWKASQARCRRIFQSEAAGLRPDVAAHLAFMTDMPSAEAISLLGTTAGASAPRGNRLGDRMARVVIPNPGTGDPGGKSEDQSFGAKALAAGKKAGIY